MSIKTLATGFVSLLSGKDLNIVLHTAAAPSNEEWSAYLRSIERRLLRGNELAGLIFSDGGAPSAVQRKEMIAMLEKRVIPTAILTKNPLIRGALTALGWFNPHLRSFAPKEIDRAFEYIGVARADVGEVMAEIERVQRLLGPGPMLQSVQGARSAT